MVKLTKAQMKDRDRIEAWIKGEPFRENSRDKHPQVPHLTSEQVLETYVPLWISDCAKFYTPLEMGRLLIDGHYIPAEPGYRILEPCSGIGNLIYHVYDRIEDGAIVDAYDLDDEAVKVGQKMFPAVNWFHATPFDNWQEIQGQYDLVLMNPPFGTTWGTTMGAEMSEGRASKSEHFFLELAIRALKANGLACVIAPYNYYDKLPKKLRAWVDDRIMDFTDLGDLPGEFRFTGIRIHGWMIYRNSYDTWEKHFEEVMSVHPEPVQAAAPFTTSIPVQVEAGKPLQLPLF